MILSEVKMLSLWQPWASACLERYVKTSETRPNWTNHRGPLLIHATKTIKDEARAAHANSGIIRKYYPSLEVLPLGGILGIVNMTDCMTTEKALTIFKQTFTPDAYEREIAFGNYALGRFAWRFENPVKIEEPIIINGSQGLTQSYRVSLLPGNIKQYILNL